MNDNFPDAPEQLCAMAIISNTRGLHARAAARFVKTVETFSADVTVTKDETCVSGRSIMGLMMLAAAQGSTVRICGSGNDAAAVLQALTDLIKRKFDEE